MIRGAPAQLVPVELSRRGADQVPPLKTEAITYCACAYPSRQVSVTVPPDVAAAETALTALCVEKGCVYGSQSPVDAERTAYESFPG